MCFGIIASRCFRCVARGWFRKGFSGVGYRFDLGIISTNPKRNERVLLKLAVPQS